MSIKDSTDCNDDKRERAANGKGEAITEGCSPYDFEKVSMTPTLYISIIL